MYPVLFEYGFGCLLSVVSGYALFLKDRIRISFLLTIRILVRPNPDPQPWIWGPKKVSELFTAQKSWGNKIGTSGLRKGKKKVKEFWQKKILQKKYCSRPCFWTFVMNYGIRIQLNGITLYEYSNIVTSVHDR